MCITHFNSRDLGVCVYHIPKPGSFLAEAVIQDLENRAVTNNDIKIWDRYVDDVFATVKKAKKQTASYKRSTTPQKTPSLLKRKNTTISQLTRIFGRTNNKG
jgi:hypothetical protein